MNQIHHPLPHFWNLTPREARELQLELKQEIITTDQFEVPRRVAGVDVGFEEKGSITRAAVAVLSYPDLRLVDKAIALQPTRFPYVPGLLSFREIPAILQALEQLTQLPEMLLCDGQGFAHPRRFGLACHLGLLTDLPSIGVAKSRLIGSHDFLPSEKGSWVPLMDQQEIIGAVLRTRKQVKPLYVSVGHRICLTTAIRYVLGCTTRYKLPETTRAAHRLASG